jgi:hypothetical protein
MSIIVQPMSCTIDSAATPDSASMPASVWLCAADRYASPSACDSGGTLLGCSTARSTDASTIHVSFDIWSRTARAARPSRSTDCASAPGRCRSAVSDHSVVGAIATISASSPSTPVSEPVILPRAPNSTGTHSLPGSSRR